MALLQISEPGQAPAPHQHKLAAGIDLGTTNSLIATVRSGLAETLPDVSGCHLLPSVVYYGASQIEVGQTAKDHVEQAPQSVISSAKRLIGRQLTEVEISQYPYQFEASEQGLPVMVTEQGKVNPIRVSADILRHLAQRAEKSLGGELEGVVITVPAYFDDAQRQATKEAAALAGLSVLRLLNEPTAAAIAYGLDSEQEGIIAVYDLGGGTFDISILRLHQGVFEVLATGGDSALGGDDFDHIIVDYFREQHVAWQNQSDPFLHQRLRQAANEVKLQLSTQQTAAVVVDQVHLSMTRDEFEKRIMPLIKRTLQACRRALKDADIDADEVQQVVMVGGSTRVPAVRAKVGEYFGTSPLTSIDPDRVVAVGAAIQADILVGNKPDADMLLLDVIPLSLGLEVMGELVEKIIPRNTTIPCARAQEFTTFKEGQTAMMIHVLQGERETVKECRSLAHFTLRGIPAMPAGGAHIRVTFQVDADGLLSVSAMEKSTGVQAAIQVKPAFGLTDDEIAHMIEDSYRYAETDMMVRKLAEAKVEAARVLESVQSALAQDRDLLSHDELSVIETAMVNVAHRVTEESADNIHAAIKQLDTVTQAFAARRMDESIRRALSGHSVDEL